MTDRFTLHHGDCIDVMRSMPDCSVDSIVTDPPYELGFMGKSWDASGIAFNTDVWTEALRVLKPGGHLLAFSGSRTYHRMAVAIEDAGFEIRDQIMWIYGSGFPKSLDVSKAIDKSTGENRQRQLRFVDWMRSTGLTAKQCDDILKTAGAISPTSSHSIHYFNEGQPQIATLDTFTILRPHLPEVPEEIERLVVERTGIEWTEYKNREVVGAKPWSNSAQHFVPGEDHTQRVNLDITAPATPQAQQWAGWGTALKPAHEPIVVARKPLTGTVAANVLAHGVGALNIDGCRVGSEEVESGRAGRSEVVSNSFGTKLYDTEKATTQGRWPANVIHDGSDEVVKLFPDTGKSTGGQKSLGAFRNGDIYGSGQDIREAGDPGYGDSGSAARFFYCAKANKRDRNEGLDGFTAKQADESRKEGNPGGDNPRNRGVNKRLNHHPTVKPTDLMRYLIRLVTPQGATILDPFMGSGSTGKAAMYEGVNFIGIEQDAEYLAIAQARIQFALNKPLEDQLFERTPPSDEELANQLALPLTNEESA